MMPRAPHRISDDQPFGKRPTVVSALPANREHVATLACDDYRLPIGVSSDHSAIGDLIESNSLLEIRA
jgi:hypothetical protein